MNFDKESYFEILLFLLYLLFIYLFNFFFFFGGGGGGGGGGGAGGEAEGVRGLWPFVKTKTVCQTVKWDKI